MRKIALGSDDVGGVKQELKQKRKAEMQLYKEKKREDNVRNGRGIKQRVSRLIALYDSLLCTVEVENTSELYRKNNVPLNMLGVDPLSTYRGDRLTCYFFVDSLPDVLDLNFKRELRSACSGDVVVTFINIMKPKTIDWSSPQMLQKLRILKTLNDEIANSGTTVYNMHESLQQSDAQRRVNDSLQYLSIADKRRGCELAESSLLLLISGTRGARFDASLLGVKGRCKDMGLLLGQMNYYLPEALPRLSPFTSKKLSYSDFVSSQTLTDEILARYTTYTQGTLGYDGTYFGTDIFSKFPVIKKVKPTRETAENMLCTAETGGGKSFMIKFLILQLLGKNMNGTIMDIEGFEYLPLARFISSKSNVQVINMAEGSGKYFDPLEIPEKTGIADIDKNARQLALDFTLALFGALLSRKAEDEWVDVCLNDAISLTYKNAGVTEDPETWRNSKGLTVQDVYKSFSLLTDKRDSEDYRKALDVSLAMLGRYFEPDGTRITIFKDRVKVEDVIYAELIVCSFGMAGKSIDSVDKVQMALMQLTAAQISHQRSIYSKARGKLNFKVWEEFQRWGDFKGSEKTLGVAVTGGRKLGDTNIIVTNDVKKILENDRFSLMGNIQSYLIGRINDSKTRGQLCTRLGITNMLPSLDLIDSETTRISNVKRVRDKETGEVKNKVTNEDSWYAYAFVGVLDGNKKTVMKVKIPNKLAKSDIFRTGVEEGVESRKV